MKGKSVHCVITADYNRIRSTGLRETATLIFFFCILIKGTASDVLGKDLETLLRNTVNDSSIVTAANKGQVFL